MAGIKHTTRSLPDLEKMHSLRHNKLTDAKSKGVCPS